MDKKLLLVGLALVLGCKEQADDTDTDPATDTDVVDCDTLDVTECAGEAACSVITGGMIQEGQEGLPNCIEPAQDLGCISADADCTQAITSAADPADPSTCFEFSNGCTPAGWVACDPDPGLSEEACPP